MTATPTITVDERRARLGLRHRLASGARTDDDIAAIADAVVALHGSDPLSVVLAALVRMQRPDLAVIERALYEERTVLRMLGMRRTIFTVSRAVAGVVQASSSQAVAAVERRRLVKLLEDQGLADDAAAWLEPVEAATLAAIEERGGAFATELTSAVPELGVRIKTAEGKPYESTVGVATRLLFLLAAEGHLVRGRPKGAWTGAQHRWVPTATWLGEPLAQLPVEAARVELVRRWLERFGPGTLADLKWWTGWTVAQVRAAVAGLDTVEVDLDGETGLVLAADAEPVAAPDPWVALLPGLDPTTMGWKQRDWYLGAHGGEVFDRNGNAGATVWADGRIVGGWAQRASGEVVFRLLDDVGAERAAAVESEAARMQALLGDVRVIPRFPAPLDRQLSR